MSGNMKVSAGDLALLQKARMNLERARDLHTSCRATFEFVQRHLDETYALTQHDVILDDGRVVHKEGDDARTT